METNFDTFYCGVIAKEDALQAQEIIREHGGIAKASKGRDRRGLLIIGYFTSGLSHEKRIGIQSAFGNAGIFAL